MFEFIESIGVDQSIESGCLDNISVRKPHSISVEFFSESIT